MKKTMWLILAAIAFCYVAQASDRRSKHIPGDQLQVGLGVLVVPTMYSNPQISFSGTSKEGFGIYLSLGTQLLPGSIEFVSLKHYSLELAWQLRLWDRGWALIGWRHAFSYPSAGQGEEADKLLWGMYYGLRLTPVRQLLTSDNISLQLSYWPTASKTKVVGTKDNWEYNSRHLVTLALSYNLEL